MILKACGANNRYSSYAAQIFYKVDSKVKLYIISNILYFEYYLSSTRRHSIDEISNT